MPVLPHEIEAWLRFIEVANGIVSTVALILIAVRTGER